MEQFELQDRQAKTSFEALDQACKAISTAVAPGSNQDSAKRNKVVESARRALEMTRQNIRRLQVALGMVYGEQDREKANRIYQQRSKQLKEAEERLKGLKAEVERYELFGRKSAAASGTTGASRSSGSSSSSGGMGSRAAANIKDVHQSSSIKTSHGGGFGDTTEEDQQILAQTMQSLDRSTTYLDESRQILSQTEETGIHILSDLGEQREGLLRAQHKVNETNTLAKRAQAALGRMSRRACYNRLLLWAIIVLLIVMIIVALYFRLKN